MKEITTIQEMLKTVNEIERRAEAAGLEMQFEVSEYRVGIVLFLADVRPISNVYRDDCFHSEGVKLKDRDGRNCTKVISKVLQSAIDFLDKFEATTKLEEITRLKAEAESYRERLDEINKRLDKINNR